MLAGTQFLTFTVSHHICCVSASLDGVPHTYILVVLFTHLCTRCVHMHTSGCLLHTLVGSRAERMCLVYVGDSVGQTQGLMLTGQAL